MFRTRLPFSISIAAALTLVVGFVVTAMLFVVTNRLESEKAALNFRQLADARIEALRQGLEGSVEVLTVLNQLFAAVDPVSREQFHTFTQPLLQRYPYIQAFNFHRLVSAEARPAYEAEMRARFPNFAITMLDKSKRVPVTGTTVYNVVDYLEPMQGNEPALGLDVSRNLDQAEAMRRAIRTGLPSSTGLLRLAQGLDGQRGFVVLMPVYRHGVDLTGVEARTKAAIGDTAVVFRARDLMEKILLVAKLLDAPGIEISVYAGDAANPGELAFHHNNGAPAGRARLLPAWLDGGAIAHRSHSFEVAGKPWYIAVSSTSRPYLANHAGSLFTLLGGILFTLLATAYLQTLSLRSRRVQQLVEERTAELSRSNERLIEDVAARKRVELALLESEERFRHLADLSSDWYWEQDEHFRFTLITGDIEGKGGVPAAYYIGKTRWETEVDQSNFDWTDHRATLEAHLPFTNLEYKSLYEDDRTHWFSINGEPLFDDTGKFKGYRGTGKDVTQSKQAQERIHHMAHHDVLTDLPNRAMLLDRLRAAIAYADRYAHRIWVAFLDVDRFKFVNDSLGHAAGDALLVTIAARLRAATRETDTVGRLGGDEFVLILTEYEDESLSAGILQRVTDTLAQPLEVAGQAFFLTCSMGVSVYPTDGTDPEKLIEYADIAMYRAKELGRNNFQFYTAAMNERVMERLRIESALRNALERKEFVLHYQPQIDLRSGQVVGMEALIRWLHPELGMVPPARFIGLAEETGLIVPIGAWVLRTACEQNKAWQRAGLGNLSIAVNLSARQFAQQDLAASIAAVLHDSGLAPQYLDIELTESLIMSDVERTVDHLHQLKALGVQLSIDDFGTGYSSLSYLKRFPIDVLKIDQSFVHDISLNPDDAAIVVSIIALAHNLKLHVIAEGVETQEQLAYLRRHGCDEMQGYYFSRPLPAKEFEGFLREGKNFANVVEG